MISAEFLCFEPFIICLHPIGTVLSHFIRNMGVDVHGKGGGSMTEILLYRFGGISLLESVDCIRMAQIVESGIVTSDLIDDNFIVPSNR